MSEMTTAILVYKQDQHELEKWVRKKKKEAFLMKATEDWTCLLIENDLRMADKWAGTVSKELNKPVLYMGIYDEFGWRTDFWEEGERRIHIDLPFERPRKAQVDLSGIVQWQRLAVQPKALDRLRDELESPRRMQPGLADLLREAFGLELLQFTSYDYVYSYSEEVLEQRGIVAVSGKKRPRVKQAILDVMQEPLGHLGYRLDPGSGGTYMPNEYRFFTNIGSYRYQIAVNLPEMGQIRVHFYPPYLDRTMDRWHDQNGFNIAIPYLNELHLRTLLIDILRQIIDVGIPWLESHQVEEIELDRIFEQTVEPAMKVKGFLPMKVPNEEKYVGSRLFCYGSDDGKWRMLYAFSEGFCSYYVFIRRYREDVRNQIIFPEEGVEYRGDKNNYRTGAEIERQLAAITVRFFELIETESSLYYSKELSGIDF
jgi:hypothetical protein